MTVLALWNFEREHSQPCHCDGCASVREHFGYNHPTATSNDEGNQP